MRLYMTNRSAKELKVRVQDLDVRIVSGMDGLLETAGESSCSIVVTAIVGMIGIRPTIAAMKRRQGYCIGK